MIRSVPRKGSRRERQLDVGCLVIRRSRTSDDRETVYVIDIPEYLASKRGKRQFLGHT